MIENDERLLSATPSLTVRGVQVFQNLLSKQAQQAMLEDIRQVVQAAPLFNPQTPSGKQMSVQMTSAGRFGWFSDRSGYCYAPLHPSGTAWPDIPATVLEVWNMVSGTARAPDCCLVNLYRNAAKMGMHQDRDENDFSYPVVSISLGDDGLFRIGGQTRGGKTESVWLSSGDVVVMGGDARLVYHGIDKTRPGASSLLSGGGRINLTLRVVT